MSISAGFTTQQYLDILRLDLISIDSIKALSEIVYQTYTQESQLHITNPKYKNYLKEIKKMLKNINERMKVYGRGMEYKNLSGNVTIVRVGEPLETVTYDDIFYYGVYKYVRETLDSEDLDGEDLDIKEILVKAFKYYISSEGKITGEHNIEGLTNAFRECIDSAFTRERINRLSYNTEEEYGRAPKHKSSRRKHKPTHSKSIQSKTRRSKARRSKARRSKARRSKARRNKHPKSNYDKSKRVKAKP